MGGLWLAISRIQVTFIKDHCTGAHHIQHHHDVDVGLHEVSQAFQLLLTADLSIIPPAQLQAQLILLDNAIEKIAALNQKKLTATLKQQKIIMAILRRLQELQEELD